MPVCVCVCMRIRACIADTIVVGILIVAAPAVIKPCQRLILAWFFIYLKHTKLLVIYLKHFFKKIYILFLLFTLLMKFLVVMSFNRYFS